VPGGLHAGREAVSYTRPMKRGWEAHLPFRGPYNWGAMMAFLAPRAIPGVEIVDASGYHRTISVDGVQGVVTVRPAPRASYLVATVRATGAVPRGTIVARLRRLFDLDTDIEAVENRLRGDSRLAASIAARSGLRVPGAWDTFELVVRAMLGQQVSVAAATTLAGRLVAAHGDAIDDIRLEPGRIFPTPASLARADLTSIGLPGARARAISALAGVVLADTTLLEPADELEATVEKLCRLPGIGPWTAHYVAMRALRQADAFPAADLGILRALGSPPERVTPAQAAIMARRWRPWRAYAVMHLWAGGNAELNRPRQRAASRAAPDYRHGRQPTRRAAGRRENRVGRSARGTSGQARPARLPSWHLRDEH